MTTVRLGGQDVPFGPWVCDCSEWQLRQEERRLRRQLQREQEEHERRRKRIEALFQASGLPARWRRRTFRDFEVNDQNREAYERALRFAEAFDPREGEGLLFVGPVGTGKTHLAAAIALELLAQEHTVVFGTIGSLLAELRSTFDESARETEAAVLRRLKRCDLLVLDDLGKEKVTEWVEQVVFEVVNARYEEQRSLIVTTNMPLREVRARYPNVGEALVDRILEMCDGVRLEGTSWRRRGLAR